MGVRRDAIDVISSGESWLEGWPKDSGVGEVLQPAEDLYPPSGRLSVAQVDLQSLLIRRHCGSYSAEVTRYPHRDGVTLISGQAAPPNPMSSHPCLLRKHHWGNWWQEQWQFPMCPRADSRQGLPPSNSEAPQIWMGKERHL